MKRTLIFGLAVLCFGTGHAFADDSDLPRVAMDNMPVAPEAQVTKDNWTVPPFNE